MDIINSVIKEESFEPYFNYFDFCYKSSATNDMIQKYNKEIISV